MKNTATPGGNRLRALREYVGKTQLEVELDASLGIGYLQRVESGKVKYPERDTLERILAALVARYTERRDILELFGYVVDTPLPDAAEIQWAIEVCQSELDSAVFPAYLLDCAHRLLTWNSLLPKLFGLKNLKDRSRQAHETNRVSMLKILFDPMYQVTSLISNPAVFFPTQIRALRYEMSLIRGEAWYNALIDEMLTRYPLFKEYWTKPLAATQNSQNGNQGNQIAARPLLPLEINLQKVGLLRFRLTSEPFAQDRRFRIIYYIPADSATIQQCIAWL